VWQVAGSGGESLRANRPGAYGVMEIRGKPQSAGPKPMEKNQ